MLQLEPHSAVTVDVLNKFDLFWGGVSSVDRHWEAPQVGEGNAWASTLWRHFSGGVMSGRRLVYVSAILHPPFLHWGNLDQCSKMPVYTHKHTHTHTHTHTHFFPTVGSEYHQRQACG